MDNNEKLKKFLAKKAREAKKKNEKTYIATLDDGINRPCKRMLTGLLTLDYLLNGVMEGSLYEISGAEGAGKSTLCWKTLEKLQYIYPGISIYYNDIEGTSKDEAFLNRFPLIKRDSVMIDAETNIEDFFSTLEEMADILDIIFVDTVAVLDLKNKVDMEKSEMGKVAGMMTRGWKRYHDIARNGIRMIAINQLRDNLDPYSPNYGPKTPGGRAYHYALTGQIGIKRDGGQSKAEKQKDMFGNDKVKAWNTVITIFKNKQGPFGKSINTVLNTTDEEGEDKFTTFDEVKELIAFSKVLGFIDEQGRQMYTVYNLSDGTEREKIRGNEALEYYVKNNIDVFIELKLNVYKKILSPDFFYSLYDKIIMIARAEKDMFDIRSKIDWNKPIQIQLKNIEYDHEKTLEEMKEKYPISTFFTPDELKALKEEYGEPWLWKLRERDDLDEEVE